MRVTVSRLPLLSYLVLEAARRGRCKAGGNERGESGTGGLGLASGSSGGSGVADLVRSTKPCSATRAIRSYRNEVYSSVSEYLPRSTSASCFPWGYCGAGDRGAHQCVAAPFGGARARRRTQMFSAWTLRRHSGQRTLTEDCNLCAVARAADIRTEIYACYRSFHERQRASQHRAAPEPHR